MMTPLVRDLGVAVRKLREGHAWSQEHLAEMAGLNRSFVGEIERGSTIVSIVTLEKLARAFDVSIAALLPDHGSAVAPSVDVE